MILPLTGHRRLMGSDTGSYAAQKSHTEQLILIHFAQCMIAPIVDRYQCHGDSQ